MADGLAKTARVITAAAAIMVVVFLAFLAAPDVFLKLFGIGLASAIFLDATLVRMVLVPAVMQILGDRNWWIPNWLERTLPRSTSSRWRPRRAGPSGPAGMLGGGARAPPPSSSGFYLRRPIRGMVRRGAQRVETEASGTVELEPLRSQRTVTVPARGSTASTLPSSPVAFLRT